MLLPSKNYLFDNHNIIIIIIIITVFVFHKINEIMYVLGMPADIYGIWYPLDYPFSQAVCVLQGVLSETATNATVLTITSFTIERYIAICFPFRSTNMNIILF